MDQLETIVFCDLLRDEEGFTGDGIDRFMGLDFSEARVFVAGVAKAAHEEPFERVALQFKSQRKVRWRHLLQFLEFGALGDQAFNDAARNAAPSLADAI